MKVTRPDMAVATHAIIARFSALSISLNLSLERINCGNVPCRREDRQHR